MSLSSEAITSQEKALHDKVSKGLEEYLQDAEQHCALEVNYFNNNTRSRSEELNLEDTGQTIQPSRSNRISSKQTSLEDIKAARNVPESLKSDTGHTSKQHSSVCTDADERHQQIMTSEDIEQDTNTQHYDGKHPVEDTTREPTPTHSERLRTLPTSTDKVIMPTKKVGCILISSHLKQTLEEYPPSSDKQAFLDIYHMLSLLDKYLYGNPKQHTHWMSSGNKYVTLLKYAIYVMPPGWRSVPR